MENHRKPLKIQHRAQCEKVQNVQRENHTIIISAKQQPIQKEVFVLNFLDSNSNTSITKNKWRLVNEKNVTFLSTKCLPLIPSSKRQLSQFLAFTFLTLMISVCAGMCDRIPLEEEVDYMLKSEWERYLKPSRFSKSDLKEHSTFFENRLIFQLPKS